MVRNKLIDRLQSGFVVCIFEMFYLNSTLNFEIPLVLVFQLEVYNKVVRLLTGLTAQQKGTTTQWYSNKTSLHLDNVKSPE